MFCFVFQLNNNLPDFSFAWHLSALPTGEVDYIIVSLGEIFISIDLLGDIGFSGVSSLEILFSLLFVSPGDFFSAAEASLSFKALLPPFLLDLDALLEQLLPPSEPPDGELPPVDVGTGDLSSATSKSSISSVVSKSTMVARDSWDLKKYSWKKIKKG